MAKWEEVDAKGRDVLLQADAVQRALRDSGSVPMSKAETRKIIDKVVKAAKMDK